MEFAWADLVSNAPMMANPSEYHTMMYELFFNGNAPQQRTKPDGSKGSVKTVRQADLDALNEIFAEARKLRGEEDPE